MAEGLPRNESDRLLLLLFRKNAVEMELAKCKMDMMSLNSQLLDAIQQKLNLSQQLEAWQVRGKGECGVTVQSPPPQPLCS